MYSYSNKIRIYLYITLPICNNYIFDMLFGWCSELYETYIPHYITLNRLILGKLISN